MADVTKSSDEFRSNSFIYEIIEDTLVAQDPVIIQSESQKLERIKIAMDDIGYNVGNEEDLDALFYAGIVLSISIIVLFIIRELRESKKTSHIY